MNTYAHAPKNVEATSRKKTKHIFTYKSSSAEILGPKTPKSHFQLKKSNIHNITNK
jgi:hypothetical protein